MSNKLTILNSDVVVDGSSLLADLHPKLVWFFWETATICKCVGTGTHRTCLPLKAEGTSHVFVTPLRAATVPHAYHRVEVCTGQNSSTRLGPTSRQIQFAFKI